MNHFYLKTFGCKVNQYDGQGLRERLLGAGLRESSLPEEADFLVVNFCVVTGRSASRCLRVMNSLKKRRPDARLIVGGCLSPDDRSRVKAARPDAILLDEEEGSAFLASIDAHPGDSPWKPVSGLEGRTRAFVKVQDGCNMNCSYCIIPSIRGGERSRPLEEVSTEVGRLLDSGRKELVLCGIRLGGYQWNGRGLAGLLEVLLREHKAHFRLRLSSLNPAEVTGGLLRIMAKDERVARHLHIPLQSGDPAVLKEMRRPYSARQYLKKVEEIRGALDNPALSTDLMVGFPGEDEEAFLASLRVLEDAAVSRVHVFPFSSRQGTGAAEEPQVPDSVKTERARRARQAARRLKERFDRSFIGKKARILVESRKEPAFGRPGGLTSRYQKAIVRDLNLSAAINSFREVLLEEYRDGVFVSRTIQEGFHEG